MKVAVWDTYVKRKDGRIMHFDIIVEESVTQDKVLSYGKEYLIMKGEGEQELTSKECKFCHIEEASPKIEQAIRNKGYYIHEMQNCD
mgnify:CR=1 FL=1